MVAFIVIVSLFCAAIVFYAAAIVIAECFPRRKKTEKEGGSWWSRHKPTKRRIIQLYAALLTNANVKGFFTGNIYTGNGKYACVPGLNCYSCPAAAGACPLGALQNALAQSGTRTPYYIFGIIILFGLLLGRTICGFLCPFGLGQELLYKIKTPKLKKSRYTRIFSYFKYVLLVVFVIAIPLIYGLMQSGGGPVPGFCKYICPAGTLGGAVGLLINPANEQLFAMLGPLFTWKFCLLVVICVACVFIYRGFCRFLCPLGAIYGFFNKIALIGVKLDKNKCTDCGLCVSHCKMDIRHVGDHECINCGECINVCPAKAISWKGSKLFLHRNAVEATETPVVTEERPLDGILLTEERPLDGMPLLSVQAAPALQTEADKAVPKKGRKKRGRTFWLQFAAWTVAVFVLVGALVYYNFIDYNFIDKDRTIGHDVGDLSPDFTLSEYFEEEPFNVYSHRGKILVLNFWTTYCTPCVEEIPHFEQLANDYADSVTVAIIHGSDIIEDVAEFITKQGWADYTAHFLQDNTEQNAYYSLGGCGTWPMTVILDEEGIIAFTRQGSVTYQLLQEQIETLMDKDQTIYDVGDLSPDFTLSEYFEEKPFNVYSHRGKILVLNFWTTYCTPCVQEIPHFEQLANDYADSVTVAIIHGSDIIEDVAKFITKQGWADYTAHFLQDNTEQNVYYSLGGRATWPMTVILDKEGIIAFTRQGSVTYQLLQEQIEALL